MAALPFRSKWRSVDGLPDARSVPTSVRSASSFVPEVRRTLESAPSRAVLALSEAPTREMPRVRLVSPPVHVRVAGVEPQLLAAARLVSHNERRVLDALAHEHDATTLAATLGIGTLAAEWLLDRLVRRGLATRHEGI